MARRSTLTVSISLLILSTLVIPSINAQDREVLIGRLSIIYGDSPSGETYTRYYITEASGNVVEVEFDTPPPYWYANQEIKIIVAGTAPTGENVVLAESYTPAEPITHDALPQAIGTRRIINILVKYSDHQGMEPHNPQFYDDIINLPDNSISDFFDELSYGKLSIEGDVAGNMWFTLPYPKNYYAPCGWGTACAYLYNLLIDAINLADPYVYFPDYENINIMIGNDLDCCAWGGSITLTLDGVTKTYGVTWDPPWAQNVRVLGHEIGHSIGLPHSGWVYAPYDSPWDVMSSGGGGGDACGLYYSMNSGSYMTLWCTLGVHTIAAYKDKLGWIDPPYKVEVNPYVTGVFTIEALSLMPSGSGLKMVKIFLPGQPTDNFYTVEARRRVGYDQWLPAEGVIIHKYEEGRNRCISGWCGSGPAYPIDSTPGDGTLDNAQWTVGQSYHDPENNLTIRVTAASDFLFTVEVSWAAPPATLCFDFGTSSSPVSPDCTRVTSNTQYSSILGYGWNKISKITSVDRPGEPDPLRRDFVRGTADREFRIRLDNGVYQIMVVIGDMSSKQKSMDIYANGRMVVSNLKVPKGSYAIVTFMVNVNDGFLTLRFHKDRDYWRINGVVVTPQT
ncbi:Beta-agarase A [archaeon HR01]|nr:Beta-agarase A [archaeon HR01]